MTNPWIEHVKAWRAQNPGVPYKVALQEASKTYTKVAKPAAARPAARPAATGQAAAKPKKALSEKQLQALAMGREKRARHVASLPRKQVYKDLGMAPIWDQDQEGGSTWINALLGM